MRPRLWHHIVTGLSGLALLGTTVYTVIRYGSLPEKIPTHFNGAGVADAFGHKNMLAVMKLVTVLMFCWLLLCSVLGRNLGQWFLPVTMAGMFAPLVHLLIAAVRK